jgi:hypothetical protein
MRTSTIYHFDNITVYIYLLFLFWNDNINNDDNNSIISILFKFYLLLFFFRKINIINIFFTFCFFFLYDNID